MPDLSDAAKKALAFWPQIEYAAANQMTTADLWSAMQDAAEELGLDRPGVSIRGVNELRSLATRIQESGRQFERAGADTSLFGLADSEAPWSRPLSEQNALGIWQVRFEHTFLTNEGIQTEWRTSMFTGNLPATVGELRDAIEEDAEAMADKYNVSHVAYGSIQVLAV